MNWLGFYEPIMAQDAGLLGSEHFDPDLSNGRLVDADPSEACVANVNMSGWATDMPSKTGMTIRRLEESDLFAAYEKLKG